MPRPTWRFSSLALLVLVALFVRAPTAAADLYHLQVENGVLGSEQAIYAQQWLAQSFVPATSFFLSRVSLFVRDRGPSEVLTVQIRPSLGGLPDPASLAGTAVNGPGTADWLNFDFDPYVELERNRTYWIVASSNAQSSQGYDWWRSGSNSAYPQGTGAFTPDGVNWSNGTQDFAFRVYGFQQPILAFSVTPSTLSLDAGQSVVFTVNFSNTGLGSANSVWVNVSLPPHLSYVTDDAILIGGVRSGSYSFKFTNLGSRFWSFQLTASALGAVPNGTVAETVFVFEGTDHNGRSFTRVVHVTSTTILNPGSTPSDFPWWILGIAAIPIAAALFLFWRRRSIDLSVEEVFVVHQNGILLAHQSKTLTPDKDADLLAAMLKTVQDFIQEAFSTREPMPMRGLQFGEFNILIEPGHNHYVAVVYRGEDDGSFASRVADLSGMIEERFGTTLESWSGDMREVRGIRDLLPVLWGQGPEVPSDARDRQKGRARHRRRVTAKGGETPEHALRVRETRFADEKG